MSQEYQNRGSFNSPLVSSGREYFNNGAFCCNICQISYYDIPSYQAHVLSLEHANMITNYHKNMVNKVNELDTADGMKASQKLDSQSEVTSTKETPVLPFLQKSTLSYKHCEPCNKSFTGPEPYQQHIVSKAHIKKITTPNTQGSDNKLLPSFSCETCDKQFSGIIPYDQHLNSDVHKKKVLSKDLLLQHKRDELLPSCSVTSTDSLQNFSQSPNSATANNQWYCHICKLQCTGSIPYNAHMTGANHMKNKRKAELEEKLQNTSGNTCKQEFDVLSLSQQQPVSNSDKMNPATSQISNGAANYSEVTETKKIPYSTRKEPDVILSDALESFESLTLENSNLTFFRPDETLNFDIENKGAKSGEIKMETSEVQAQYESTEDCQKEKSCLFTCEVCDVNLQKAEDVALHFASIEHYIKMKS